MDANKYTRNTTRFLLVANLNANTRKILNASKGANTSKVAFQIKRLKKTNHADAGCAISHIQQTNLQHTMLLVAPNCPFNRIAN